MADTGLTAQQTGEEIFAATAKRADESNSGDCYASPGHESTRHCGVLQSLDDLKQFADGLRRGGVLRKIEAELFLELKEQFQQNQGIDVELRQCRCRRDPGRLDVEPLFQEAAYCLQLVTHRKTPLATPPQTSMLRA